MLFQTQQHLRMSCDPNDLADGIHIDNQAEALRAQVATTVGDCGGSPAVEQPVNQCGQPQADHRSCRDVLEQVTHCAASSH